MSTTRAACSLALLSILVGSTLWGAPAAPGKRGRKLPPPHSVSRLNLAQAAERLRQVQETRAPKLQADTLRLVALRVEFPNLAMGESEPMELHDRFYFQTQFGYVSQFFRAASKGALEVRVDVPDTVALAAQEQEYYGDFALYDSLMIELTGEALRTFDAVVDFRDYDGAILLHAGPGQESDVAGDSPFQIWSGYLDNLSFQEELSTPDSVVFGLPTNDGDFLLRDIIILPEWQVQDLKVTNGTRLGHLGVYAHEIGQKLGMIPLFDADPSPIPDSQGIGNFGVMSYGLWVANGFIPALPCAFNRLLMGWVQPIEVVGDAEILLHDLERGAPDSVVVRIPISAREYFLVSYILEDPDGPIVKECKGQMVGPARFFEFEDKNGDCEFNYEDLDGNEVMSPGDAIDSYEGAEWDFFMTDLIGLNTAGLGYGLLILHVDEQVLQEVVASGSTNVERDARRKAVDVEEADGIEDLDRFPDNPRSFGSFEDYFVRGRVFGPEGIPTSQSTNGAPTGIEIELVDLPDSVGTLPGGRALVRVLRGPVAQDQNAPQLRGRREIQGTVGADLVALPLEDGRAALVLPAPQGEVLLVDSNLDEAPVSDNDPTTLLPWQTVPAEIAGSWSAPPVVGDLDGDGAAELVLTAVSDSAGGRVTRLFAWRHDGREFVDSDGDPMTNSGYLATFPGATHSLLLFDLHDDPGMEIVVATQDSGRGCLQIYPAKTVGCPLPLESARQVSCTFGTTPGWVFGAGPAGVRGPVGDCNDTAGLVWVEMDTLSGAAQLRFDVVLDCCNDSRPVTLALDPVDDRRTFHLIVADLDADGSEEVVVASEEGQVDVVAFPTEPSRIHRRRSNRLGDRLTAPLALADLDANGTLEILATGETAMHVLSLSGAELPGWPALFARERELEREPQPGRSAGSPLAADLDGDGHVEVLAPLPGGALLVWNAQGERLSHLEASLPAVATSSALFIDLDGNVGAELAALGHFERTRGFDAAAESLYTEPLSETAIWDWPAIGAVQWSQLSGSASHAYRIVLERSVDKERNNPLLHSFRVAPNPAADRLRARITLTAPARATCRLYNLEGEIVQEKSLSGVGGEIVEFQFDLSAVAPGIYLAQMQLSTGGRRVLPVAVRH